MTARRYRYVPCPSCGGPKVRQAKRCKKCSGLAKRGPIRHGTDVGYWQHRKRGLLPACKPCLRAHAEVSDSEKARTLDKWRRVYRGQFARTLDRLIKEAEQRRATAERANRHGNTTAYNLHRKKGEPPCEYCRWWRALDDAIREYQATGHDRERLFRKRRLRMDAASRRLNPDQIRWVTLPGGIKVTM